MDMDTSENAFNRDFTQLLRNFLARKSLHEWLGGNDMLPVHQTFWNSEGRLNFGPIK